MEVQYRGSGKIFFKDNEYRCDLYYNEKLGGVLIDINHMENMGNFLELPIEIDYLSGQLENGFKFILYKSIRTKTNNMISYGKTVYTYEAENIFCGVGGKEHKTLSFYKVEYTLSDIVEWGEVTVYEIGEKYELIAKEALESVLYENNEISILYKVYGSRLPIIKSELLREKIELEQHGVIEIRVQNEQELEYFNSVFQKIKRLIEIASLRKINLEKMEVFSKEIFDLYGDSKFDRPILVYGLMITEYKTDEIKPLCRRHSWLSLSELMENNCFEKYFEKYELLEPIIELYLESFYASSSNRRTFLNVVQALETYHSRFITNDIEKYKQRVEQISKSSFPEVEQKNKSYLMANSKSFITLESRLADLLFAERKFVFDTGDINNDEFPKVIAKTRNYYIHYDERINNNCRILAEEELGIYNKILFFILEYYILKELGFTENLQELRKKLTERWGNVSHQLDIIKMSREMD